jgi:outer membrane protein assembly factor BamB
MTKRPWVAIVFALSLPGFAATASVVTYHNSNLRHGAYRVPNLTFAVAANMHRDTDFNATVDGHIYAQPLYWRPLNTHPGLVIVATESNIVYALNDTTGSVVWQKQLAAPVPRSELPCGNIDPMGITGTPVIDPATATLYLNAMTESANGPRHMVYALSLADGTIVPNWPIDVEAGLTAEGAVFSSSVQGERSALLLFGDNLYVNYAGNAGDCGTYRGTVVQIDPNAASIVANWQTRTRGGGIWAQGGIAGDGAALFVTTGNTFGASEWSDGEAIIRLLPGLARSDRPRDFFTPANWKALDSSDKDLGGTEALPLDIAVSGAAPAHRLIAFGKDGNAYLADRRNLGGIGGQLGILQVSPSPIRTAPAVYETDTATMVAFTSSAGGSCTGKNITMLNVAASASPMSVAWCAPLAGAGAPIITTTDGVSNSIVWAVGAEGDNMLHGFNALTGDPVFSGGDTAMTGLHHFQTVIATQLRFYVAGDNAVYAFKFTP